MSPRPVNPIIKRPTAIFSHRRQLLFIGADFASKLASRGGAPPTSNLGFAHTFFVVIYSSLSGVLILYCFLQWFLMVFQFALLFTMVCSACRWSCCYLQSVCIPCSHVVDFHNDIWWRLGAGWALGGRCCNIFGCCTLLQKSIGWKVFAAPWHVVRSPRRLCIIAHIVVISP